MRGADSRETSRARRLRQQPTQAELRLWQVLRARGLRGYKFVRQEPIGPYVVDFVCREHLLIVEADGGQHLDSDHDATRDRWLRDHGYRILRFWNNDILANVEGVWETISAALP